MVPIRKTISKGRLKARMLEIFRELEANGGEVIVTDRDRPVLRISPIEERRSVHDVFGHLWGKVTIPEDIDEPLTDEWEDL